ncbi:hypothetical protein ACOME3_008357 [Neoechinorhynchus agilis]
MLNRGLQCVVRSLNLGFRTCTVKEISRVQINIMDSSVKQDVFKLINKDFVKREPLNAYLKLESSGVTEKVCRQMVESGLNSQLSTVAIDKANESVIGVQISFLERPGMEDVFSGATQNSAMDHVAEILDKLTGEVDLYEHFETDKLLHLMVAIVNEEYVGQRIGQRLVSKSLDAAVMWNSCD